MSTPIQILVPLAAQGDRRELKYAVRSWEQAYGEIKLLFVGPSKPELFPAAEWLPVADRSQNSYRNIQHALAVASESPLLEETFIYLNDDIYLLGPVSVDPELTFYQGTLAEKVASFTGGRYNPYRASIAATDAYLQSIGKKTRLNFEVHTPMLMSKVGLQQAVAAATQSSEPLQLRSLVGNLSKPKTVLVGMSEDVKVRDSGPKITSWPGKSFLSSQETVFDRVADFLAESFPKPSRAELVRWVGMGMEELGGEAVEWELPEELYAVPGMRPFNPSLAWVKGKLWASLRYSFFWTPGVDDTGLLLRGKKTNGKYGVSHMVLAELDPKTYRILRWKKLELTGAPDSHANLGLEDLRLFEDGGVLHGIGVFLHRDGTPNGNHQQAVVRLAFQSGRAHFVHLLERTPEQKVEKNWAPIVGRPECFVYSATQLWDAGVVSGEPYAGSIHGGTQLVPYRDGYLSLVHNFVARKLGPTKSRHYVHYWAFHGQDGAIQKLSEGFTFGWELNGIEFASGLANCDGLLLVSYGVGDADARLATFDPERIYNALTPYDPTEERQVIRS